jgi:hypothetical protein
MCWTYPDDPLLRNRYIIHFAWMMFFFPLHSNRLCLLLWAMDTW